MSISNLEKNILLKQKIKEGRSLLQAEWEVERDIAYQKELKCNLKALNEELKALKKENGQLHMKILELERSRKGLVIKQLSKSEGGSKLSKSQHKMDKEYKFKANLVQLQRVMNYISGQKEICSMTQVYKDCLIRPDVARQILKFLVKYNLIKEIDKNGATYYQAIVT